MIVLFTILFIINSIVWYAFFYYLLDSIKRDVDLAMASLKLFILASLAVLTCPFFYFMLLYPVYKMLEMAWYAGEYWF